MVELEDDVEQWYWDEVKKIDKHARQLEALLDERVEKLKKTRANPFSNVGLDYVSINRGEIRKTERCLNHATKLADYTERISAKSGYNGTKMNSTYSYVGLGFGIVGLIFLIVGLFVMGLSSFWIGFGLTIAGLIMILIGLLLFIGSKTMVWAIIAGSVLGIGLLAFIILIAVVL